MQYILSKMIERQIWRKVSSRDFWPTCRRNWNEGDFITNLRVDRGTFLLIVERLTPSIHREMTRMRQSIDVDEGVATVLWRYGSGDSARTIASMFAVGEHASRMRSKLLVPNLTAYRLLNQYLSTSVWNPLIGLI